MSYASRWVGCVSADLDRGERHLGPVRSCYEAVLLLGACAETMSTRRHDLLPPPPRTGGHAG